MISPKLVILLTSLIGGAVGLFAPVGIVKGCCRPSRRMLWKQLEQFVKAS